MFPFYTVIPPRSRGFASAKAEGEGPPPDSYGNQSKLVKEICQVMVSELREEVHTKLRLRYEKMIKLGSNTMKIVDNLLVGSYILASTVLSAVVIYKLAQLRDVVSVII